MDLGTRIRKARLEAGLSQRQLCADVITRNMLSQIENGSAKPSMQTLQHLASVLQKPMSYFLEEQVVLSANQQVMHQARQAYTTGNASKAVAILSDYQAPDPTFDHEKGLIHALSLISLAEQALSEGKETYCIHLLEQAKTAGENTGYYTQDLERRRLLLLAKAAPEQTSLIADFLPDITDELLIRAIAAHDPQRRLQLLNAANAPEHSHWQLLCGETLMQLQRFAEALPHLEQVLEHDPARALPLLEQCCRELEDYKMAYHYARKRQTR